MLLILTNMRDEPVRCRVCKGHGFTYAPDMGDLDEVIEIDCEACESSGYEIPPDRFDG